jgi:aspartyl-tRNA(Asn)/glutamyl-tRNA(Gln) amidotransferase subunit A
LQLPLPKRRIKLTPYPSLLPVRRDLMSGKLQLTTLVQQYLDNIASTRHLNAYIEVFATEALARAKALDEKRLSDPDSIGPLHGMVISIKDNICYEGHKASAGSRIIENYTAIYSATAIERVLAADAIIIGRTNCDEFGMGSTNEHSWYGPVRNPVDPERIPGGSSGGAAVAVATGTCLAALGSDTGGSIRQPAAFCGILGLKPTYGCISRHGLIAYGSSFDQIGILAQHTTDIEALLEVMAGPDEFDATAHEQQVDLGQTGIDRAKIAYFGTAFYHERIDPEIQQESLRFMEKLRAQGHELVEVPFEYLDYIIPAYYVLTTAEASSNLSRYDGVRFGYRAAGATTLKEMYVRTRTEGFGKEVKRRIMLGTYVLSAGYYDAYYTKAQQVRRLIRDRTLEILQDFDFILMPVSPVPPWKLGEKTADPVANYLADIYTVQANMAGIPALAFPVGKTSTGLPIGIQLMSKPFTEGQLLHFVGQHAFTTP